VLATNTHVFRKTTLKVGLLKMCLQQPSRLIKLLRFQQSIPYNNSWNFVQRCLKMDIDLFIDVSLLLLPHGISDLNSKPTKQWWSKTCVLFCFFLVYRECLYAPYFQIIFIDNIWVESPHIEGSSPYILSFL
jgi:hypothetical protein